MTTTKVAVQVQYPVSVADKFNLDYYLNTHLDVAHKAFAPKGLLSYQVTKTDPASGIFLIATMIFESQQKWDEAIAGEPGQELMKDLPNFSPEPPQIVVGEIIATG
ncbi:Hypothetical protein D9617_13g099290 [Elsinoe fawcettii]|nr:Hypothetical protein D9617_13g099290 [Elsinoe fawcettii]